MNIRLHSNLDDFHCYHWPKEFERVPMVGETIVAERYYQHIWYTCKEMPREAKAIPVRQERQMSLNVCNVSFMSDGSVVLELHFKHGIQNMDWWEKMKPNHSEYIEVDKEAYNRIKENYERDVKAMADKICGPGAIR